jgi:hypothetical protein
VTPKAIGAGVAGGGVGSTGGCVGGSVEVVGGTVVWAGEVPAPAVAAIPNAAANPASAQSTSSPTARMRVRRFTMPV